MKKIIKFVFYLQICICFFTCLATNPGDKNKKDISRKRKIKEEPFELDMDLRQKLHIGPSPSFQRENLRHFVGTSHAEMPGMEGRIKIEQPDYFQKHPINSKAKMAQIKAEQEIDEMIRNMSDNWETEPREIQRKILKDIGFEELQKIRLRYFLRFKEDERKILQQIKNLNSPELSKHLKPQTKAAFLEEKRKDLKRVQAEIKRLKFLYNKKVSVDNYTNFEQTVTSPESGTSKPQSLNMEIDDEAKREEQKEEELAKMFEKDDELSKMYGYSAEFLKAIKDE